MLEFIRKMLLLSVIYQVFLLYDGSFAKEPDGAICFANYEISYFCNPELFNEANAECKKHDSYLAKINESNIATAIDSLIGNTTCSHINGIFIGARAIFDPEYPRDRSKRTWKWLDGSKVNLPDSVGYQNWKSGQPNDFDKQEDCVILDKYSRKWKDTICRGSPPDPKYYICQKVQSETNIQIEDSEHPHTIHCSAYAGYCTANTTWRRGDTAVSNNSYTTVYQTTSLGISILHYQTATIGDAGEYVCVAWLNDDTMNSIADTTIIPVNGAPDIKEIKPFVCNTSLQVLWKPNVRSLGFHHKIITTLTRTNETVDVAEVTPTETDLHFTEVSGLNSSSEYNINVVACRKRNNCPDEYATRKKTTTRGIIVKVSNAILLQNNATDNDTCVVTWEGPHDYNVTSYQLTIHNSSQLGFSKNNIAWSDTIMGTNYTFLPIPDQKYEVEIQPVTNESYCPQSSKAVGSCVGKNHDIVNEEGESKQTNALLIIIPSSAVGCVVVLAICIFVFCKRMKSSRESTAGMTTNPIYGVTDYENLHSSSKYQDVRDQEEAAGGECSTTKREDLNEEKDGSSDVAIYAVVNKPNVKRVDEKGSSDAAASDMSGKKSAQSTENMVVNPIYDMEPSTSQSTESDNDQKVDLGPANSDQQSSTDDPIYSAVKKVKIKKNKKGD